MAIDGKTLRGTAEKRHLVSAWASESGISLGHAKVDSKSNEITVIPELLKVLMLKGCIVTIDAMGCKSKLLNRLLNNRQTMYWLSKVIRGHFMSIFKLSLTSVMTHASSIMNNLNTARLWNVGMDKLRHVAVGYLAILRSLHVDGRIVKHLFA